MRGIEEQNQLFDLIQDSPELVDRVSPNFSALNLNQPMQVKVKITNEDLIFQAGNGEENALDQFLNQPIGLKTMKPPADESSLIHNNVTQEMDDQGVKINNL